MKPDHDVSIVLTNAQLTQVVRQTAHGGQGVASLLAAFDDPRSLSAVVAAQSESAKISRSVLRALLVLAAFPLDGTYRPLADVSKEVGYNPSTTHRYVSTWLTIGLLEQDPKSRRYRRPTSPARDSPAIGRTAKPRTTRKARRATK